MDLQHLRMGLLRDLDPHLHRMVHLRVVTLLVPLLHLEGSKVLSHLHRTALLVVSKTNNLLLPTGHHKEAAI